MATNAYCTVDDLRQVNNIKANDTSLDGQFDIAIGAASRQIDAFCGRRFWQDGTVKTREFYPDDSWNCYVDDISTTTGLIVQTDNGDNGFVTSALTLTITSDFIVLPANAADEIPVWPYTRIRLVSTSVTSFTVTRRPTVRVTAQFGWPAVPDDVRAATIYQAQQLRKGADSVFGGIDAMDGARVLHIRLGLNPLSMALCEPYVKQTFSRT